MYPRIVINTNIIKSNTEVIVNLCNVEGIDVVGVTKGICAQRDIVQAIVDGGVKYLGDSRIKNLIRLQEFSLPKMMLRIPMISQAKDIVKYADISLNSELDTIIALSKEAVNLTKNHKIILMIDLGDLREGIFTEEELFKTVEEIFKLENIELIGFGSNLTCYGGVIPDKELINRLIYLSELANEKYNLSLDIISGGNSSSLHLLKTEYLKGLNNLRIGEAILIGRETSYGKQIANTSSDGIYLEAEIIEIKEKPSIPMGTIGRDAFGNKPSFVDKGNRIRMILAIGRQDIKLDSIIPIDKDIKILGGSSDHLIIDCTDSKVEYKIGDVVKFNLKYGGILSAMTSEYVDKVIINQ